MSETVLVPPEARPLPAVRLARRRHLLVSEIESGNLRRIRPQLPSLPSGRPTRARVVLIVAVVLLLGAVGTAVGVGITLATQQDRLHDEGVAIGDYIRFGEIESVVAGDGWELFAWKSDHGICVDYVVPGRSVTNCGFPVVGAPPSLVDPGSNRKRQQLDALVTNLGGGILVAGPAAPAVARVELELADGSRRPVAMYAAPDGLESPLRFFLLRIPAGDRAAAPVALRAYDAQGVPIQRRPLNAAFLNER